MHKALFLLAAPLLTLLPTMLEDDPRAEDRKQIERAALDYVEAFCEGKPELLERSVDPELAKVGFWYNEDSSTFSMPTMTRDQAVELSKVLHANGHVPEGATHKIKILDHLDKTAAVRVDAFWGVDYMHLIKEKDEWKIRHVIWQSVPDRDSEKSD